MTKNGSRGTPATTSCRPPGQRYDLLLYISGATELSRLAIANIRRIGEKHLQGRYQLVVVDLYQQAQLAHDKEVIALPTLVKRRPLPVRRMVGDLSNEERVLAGLDLCFKQRPDEDGR